MYLIFYMYRKHVLALLPQYSPSQSLTNEITIMSADIKLNSAKSNLPSIEFTISEAARIILGGTDTKRFWGFTFEEFIETMHSGLFNLVMDPAKAPWRDSIIWRDEDYQELKAAISRVDARPTPAHRFDLEAVNSIMLGAQIVAFSGPIESGKTTGAEALVNIGYESMGLADVPKIAWSLIYGIPLRYFNDHELKKTMLRGSNLTPRSIMQVSATEVCRTIFDRIWVQRLALRIASRADSGALQLVDRRSNFNIKVAVHDLRFQNEADFFRELKALVVRVSRPGKIPGDAGTLKSHVSEMGFSKSG